MKEWFRFRTSWNAAIRTLSPEEGGRLLLAVLDYTISGEAPALSGAAQAVFAMIAETLDRDAEVSSKRAAAGAKGGKQTRANTNKRKQTEANGSKKQQNQATEEASEVRKIKACDSLQLPKTVGENRGVSGQNTANTEPEDRKTDRETDHHIYVPPFCERHRCGHETGEPFRVR